MYYLIAEDLDFKYINDFDFRKDRSIAHFIVYIYVVLPYFTDVFCCGSVM